MIMISLLAPGICPLDKTIKTGTTATTQTRQQQQGSTSIVTEITSRQIIRVTRYNHSTSRIMTAAKLEIAKLFMKKY